MPGYILERLIPGFQTSTTTTKPPIQVAPGGDIYVGSEDRLPIPQYIFRRFQRFLKQDEGTIVSWFDTTSKNKHTMASAKVRPDGKLLTTPTYQEITECGPPPNYNAKVENNVLNGVSEEGYIYPTPVHRNGMALINFLSSS